MSLAWSAISLFGSSMVWGCACSYDVAVPLWSSSRPCLANASACSLPLMFLRAFILWSVVMWVRDINNLVI